LFCRGSASRIFKFSKKKVNKKKEEEPSLGDIYKYLPKNHHMIVGDLSSKTRNLLAVLPVTYIAQPSPEIEFSVSLYPKPEGETFALPVEIDHVHKVAGNKDIVMIEMKLPDPAPGEYELEIEAIEKNTSSRFSIRRSLTVK
jgi:hypothetical protein